jgi:hypothetical protein
VANDSEESVLKFKRLVLALGFGLAVFAVGPPVALANM